jgi:aspartate/methionine/tyrosine aminotransferase
MMKLPPFKLERYFARHEFNAEYLLCSSDCESMTIGELLAFSPGAMERFRQHWLGYTESQGAPGLRNQISKIYNQISPDQVLVHSGAEEAIFLFMQAALKSGDHLIVHAPCYQSLAEVARAMGCEVTFWQGCPSQGWALDPDELRHAIRPSTRAVVINMPHNPTGYLMSGKRFEQLIRIVREHNLILFSDEVYRESEYISDDRLPAACDLDEQAVSLGVLSKSYGLPGLRIGWIATRNAAIYNAMTMLKDYTTICNSAPSEFLAELALQFRAALAERSVGIIRANLVILDDLFARHADYFEWQRPRAGPIAFPRLMRGDVDTFCHELMTVAGVLLLPGSVYDHRGNHFRIGFGRRNLPQAAARLEQFLQRPAT